MTVATTLFIVKQNKSFHFVHKEFNLKNPKEIK